MGFFRAFFRGRRGLKKAFAPELGLRKSGYAEKLP
jgi:hypothetical protein